jgi:hypothetical protein
MLEQRWESVAERILLWLEEFELEKNREEVLNKVPSLSDPLI